MVADAKQGQRSFAQRAEDLFNRLADENCMVNSEAPDLVEALTNYLDLEVTEDQVLEATRQHLEPMENKFMKENFLRFVMHLQPEPPAAQPSAPDTVHAAPIISPTQQYDSIQPNHTAPVAGDSNKSATSGAQASWVFEPMVGVDDLEVDARSYAEQVYAKVEQAMELLKQWTLSLKLCCRACRAPCRSMRRGSFGRIG